MNCLPASSFKLLSGKGTIKRHFTTEKMWDRDQLLGFQSFFSVFTHISPLGWATFGWKILVRKNPNSNYKKVIPFGGFCGNSESITSLHLNTPPSYAVPTNIKLFKKGKLTWAYNVCLDVKNISFYILLEQKP